MVELSGHTGKLVSHARSVSDHHCSVVKKTTQNPALELGLSQFYERYLQVPWRPTAYFAENSPIRYRKL